MTTPSYLDHILNGAMVLDEQCCVLFWNHWLEIQTGIKRGDIVGQTIFDFFPDINPKQINRKLKQIFALNTPAFITAEADKYLLKIPSRKISDKIFDNMLQNVVISVYDRNSRYSLFMIYDQTSLYEAKARLELGAKNLEEQRSLLQNTIDFQTNILFVIDSNKIVSCNNNFLELFGYDITDRINSGSADLLDSVIIEKNPEFENIFPSFYAFIEDSLKRNRMNKLSVLNKNTSKETVFLFSARKMPDSDRIIVSMTDITLLQNREKVLQDINLELGRRYDEKNIELKKLNFDLSRSRDQLQLAQEVANVGSFEYTGTDGYVYLSQGMKAIFDNPAMTAAGLDDIIAYFRPDYRQKISFLIHQAYDTGIDFSAYAEIVSKTGIQKPIGIHCRVFGGANETNKRLIVTLNDLSNVKQLEKQIQDKEQLVSSLFDVADISFIITDMENRIFRVNKAFSVMTGYSQEEMVESGLDCLKITDYKSDYEKYVRPSSGCMSEVILRRKDGKDIFAYMNVSSFAPDESSNFKVMAFTDITDRVLLMSEQKEQEQLLIQQSKMAAMGEMIGVIGHQWKQPLNSISLIMDGIRCDLEDGVLENDEINRRIETCLEQVQFMAETIDDFRSFFSHDTAVGAFDISDAVSNTVRLLTPLFERHGTKIDISGELHNRVFIRGIANEFRHTLMNILTNSKDAINSKIETDRTFKGRIGIRMDADESNIRVTVSDNGGGIPEHLLEHIFKPYFTTKGNKGTGIGMYLAQIIINKKMNGSITVKNTDVGACITIILPITER